MIESATLPMSLCSRIRLSWPISEKLGVYAPDRSAGRAASRSSLPRLKRPSGSIALLVLGERRQLVVRQVLELGDADAVLARDHAAQAARERHDARDRRVGLLQHCVVVGVDGDVGVHVAVARVHVQRDEHAAAQHPRVDVRERAHHRREREPGEDLLQRRLQLALPRDDHRVVLQRGERLVDAVEQVLPAGARGRDQLARLVDLGVDDLLRRPRRRCRAPRRARAAGSRGTPRARRASRSLLRIDSSMLIRSMPSV